LLFELKILMDAILKQTVISLPQVPFQNNKIVHYDEDRGGLNLRNMSSNFPNDHSKVVEMC